MDSGAGTFQQEDQHDAEPNTTPATTIGLCDVEPSDAARASSKPRPSRESCKRRLGTELRLPEILYGPQGAHTRLQKGYNMVQ